MTPAPLTVSRVFKAPVALVWAIYTDPAHQARWLSPGNPDAYVSRMDFRVGAKHFYGAPGPDGAMMYGVQTFREIVPLTRVVLVQSYADKDGKVAPHPMAPTWPREMLATNDYADLGDGTTRLQITWLPLDPTLDPTAEEAATFDAARGGMTGGWEHQFGQVADYLATLVQV